VYNNIQFLINQLKQEKISMAEKFGRDYFYGKNIQIITIMKI